MKKLLFTLVILCTTVSFGFSQTEQGNLMLGGSIQLSSQSQSDESLDVSGDIVTDEYPSSSSFSIMPEVGYFVSDGFALGLGIGYRTTTTESSDTTSTTNNTFQIAPFARYYAPIDDNISFFGQLHVGYASRSGETETPSRTSESPTTNIIDVGITPGLAIFASDRLSINFRLPSVISFKNESTDREVDRGDDTKTLTDSNSNFNFNLSMNGAGFGVNYYF